MPGPGRRFQPGHPGGPGRRPREVERNYLRATIDCVSIAEWKEIVNTAKAEAIAGDRYAREWLRLMLVGNDPVETQLLNQELRDALELFQHGHQTNGAAAVGHGLRDAGTEESNGHHSN